MTKDFKIKITNMKQVPAIFTEYSKYITNISSITYDNFPHLFYNQDAGNVAILRVVERGTTSLFTNTNKSFPHLENTERILEKQIDEPGVYFYDIGREAVVFEYDTGEVRWDTELWDYKPIRVPINSDSRFMMVGGYNSVMFFHPLSAIPRICHAVTISEKYLIPKELHPYGLGIALNFALRIDKYQQLTEEEIKDASQLISLNRVVPDIPDSAFQELFLIAGGMGQKENELDLDDIDDETLSSVLTDITSGKSERFEKCYVRLHADFAVPFEYQEMILTDGTLVIFSGDPKLTPALAYKGLGISDSILKILIESDGTKILEVE